MLIKKTNLLSDINYLRAKQLDDHPFWSLVSMRLKILETTNGCFTGRPVETAMTDGTHLVVNPDYFYELIREERMTLFLHELGHVVLGHHLRRGDRDMKIWNIACDQEDNLMLKGAGCAIPDNWYCDPKFKGWSAERIYAEMEQESGDEPGEEPGGEPGDNPGDDKKIGEPGGKPGGEPGDTSGPPPPPGEVWDAVNPEGDPLNEQEIEEAKQELIEDIQMASAADKSCGLNGNPTMKRSINRLARPEMNWRNYVNQWIREKGKPIGRSWSKADRRSMVNRIYQPGVIKDGVEWLVFAVDISSSIAMPEYHCMISHMEKIRQDINIERITIVPFNAVIQQQQIKELTPRDKMPKSFDVGGGTAFSPIFNWIRRQKGEPDGIIVFTDLCCGDYGKPTRAPILWACTEEVYRPSDGWGTNCPPFGNVIQIDTI